LNNKDAIQERKQHITELQREIEHVRQEIAELTCPFQVDSRLYHKKDKNVYRLMRITFTNASPSVMEVRRIKEDDLSLYKKEKYFYDFDFDQFILVEES
jgi:hypothetical protein